MWPDRVSNPGPLTYASGALPTMLRGLAFQEVIILKHSYKFQFIAAGTGLKLSEFWGYLF